MLRIGDKGDAVRNLQNLLISKGYSCGPAGADGDFGQSTYNAVIKFQGDHGLSQDGIVGPATWRALDFNTSTSSAGQPMLRTGDKGDAVRNLQNLLISKGYSCGSAGADGDFGQSTYNAVIKFQGDHGLSQDGIVGPNTWSVLISNRTTSSQSLLSIGSKGDAVKTLQYYLISKGYSCGSAGADGDFGQSTYNAVIKFQGDHGLSQDGIVGPNTWEALISGSFVKDSNNSYKHFTANRAELQRFIDAASKELATGFEEEYDPKAGEGNNITKYGLWYDDGCFEDDGIHGKGAWCAAFVSYCANEAGILNKIIPKFCSVPRGVNWYYNHGRLAFRQNYTPKPGDIFFKFNGKRYSHTGIVVECSNGYVTTIEGNSGDKIASNRIPLTSNDVAAFGIN